MEIYFYQMFCSILFLQQIKVGIIKLFQSNIITAKWQANDFWVINNFILLLSYFNTRYMYLLFGGGVSMEKLAKRPAIEAFWKLTHQVNKRIYYLFKKSTDNFYKSKLYLAHLQQEKIILIKSKKFSKLS